MSVQFPGTLLLLGVFSPHRTPFQVRQAEHIARLDCGGRGGAVADSEGELERVGYVHSGEVVLDLDKDLELAERDVPPLGEEWERLAGDRSS